MIHARRVATFRLEDDLLDGMQKVWLRDGVHPSEQVRRALRAWLHLKQVQLKPAVSGSERARLAWIERRKKYGTKGRRA